MHIISLSSVRHLPCPQYSNFPSFILPRVDLRNSMSHLGKETSLRATMHIISLSSTAQHSHRATIHKFLNVRNNIERQEPWTRPSLLGCPCQVSIISFDCIQSKHQEHHLTVASRQWNLPSCNHAHHLAVLRTAPFLRANMHITLLSSEPYPSFVLPCTSSHSPRYSILTCAIMHILLSHLDM